MSGAGELALEVWRAAAGEVSRTPFVTRLELKGPDGGDLRDEKRCVRWSQP
jgi:hypothetical protein